jgi:phosphocarrier protein FPr
MRAPGGGGALGVGIVVVSHSRALATAAVALAGEMVHGAEPRIAVAAGLDEATFGTDAVEIAAAIERVDSEAGVVVLMDLGSAVLSAEFALDLLPDDAVRRRVLLCPAPLVEGLVVAAVAAAGGASRQEVADEARSALLAKAAHLAPEAPAPAADPTGEAGSSATFTVANMHGLHARPSARLVAEVRRLDAAVTLRNLTTGGDPVPAASLSRVATLGALQGHVVEVTASGRQAGLALDHVLALAARRFDETDDAAAEPEAAPAGEPRPASPGIGIGPVRRLTSPVAVPDEAPAGPPAGEWRRLVEAIAEARRDIERLRTAAAQRGGAEAARIFEAHLLLLDDGELLGPVRATIDAGSAAPAAWATAVAAVAEQWAALPDPYLRARVADVRAVGEQVLRALAGESAAAPVAVDGVLVADDLTPGQAAVLDPATVRAVVLAGGSPASHASILIRSLGIPAVCGAGSAVLDLAEGTPVVVDGTTGRVVVAPDPSTLAAYQDRAARAGEQRAREAADAARPAVTADGVLVEVAANLASAAEARTAAAAGADGAGLIRTELVFLDRDRPPTADEQEREYRAMAAAFGGAFGGRPITIRTLDVGGDKPLPYLPQPAEANPYLGLRGLRLSLTRPELLTEQLAAICRVAREAPVKVMFPMVSTVDELRAARRLLDSVCPPPGLRVGIMVEVPAAALSIDAFLPHVDFVSIGTNDLTQYTLAAERGNAAVAELADPLDPAVLRLIAEVGRRAAGRVPVSVCGEVAADPLAVPVLLGAGVTELSVAVAAVPAVKAAVRALDLRDCVDLAKRCLEATSAAEVRRLAAEFGHPARGEP